MCVRPRRRALRKRQKDVGRHALHDGVDGLPLVGPIDIVSAGTGEMRKRYGFVYVDRDNEGHGTMRRSKKDSFAYYRNIIDTNGEDP